MKTMFIKIQGIDNILCFVKNADLVDGDVTIRKGKYVIDGRSYLGLVALDPSNGVTVEYPAEAVAFEQYLNKLILEEK